MDSRTKPGWPTFLDGAFDGVVLAFAGWTVFYQFALAYQFSMLWAGWPWILLAACLAVVTGLHTTRRAQRDVEEPGQPGHVDQARQPDLTDEIRPRPTRPVDVKVLAGGLVVLVVLATRREQWGIWPIAVTGIAMLAFQLLPWRARRIPRETSTRIPGPKADVGPGAHLFALAVSLGFGALGMFLLRPDADDVFYVNRATWVAQHGTAATNDTMFGPNVLPPANDGGLLTPSIEALQGVMAHAFGLEAPTVCYLLVVPVLGIMAGWTTWRLVRALAPRRPVLVMAASMLFLLASADSVIGGYSLGRIWQGKAAAYSILIPLVWLLLIRTVDRARRTELVMLAAAGIAFVGLTTTSALLAPVVAGSALVAAALVRSKSLALGALVFLAAPLANGLAQAFGSATIGGGDTEVVPMQHAFELAFGPDLMMVLLALIAVALIPRLVPGLPGVVLGCGGLAMVVAMLPGVFALAHALTGAGPVAWRLLIAMPVWVLVGLLVALPGAAEDAVHSRRSLLVSGAAVMAAVVIVVPLVFGTLLWKAPDASLTARPTWKVNQAALSDVRAARQLDLPGGLWLLPPEQMKVLAISRVGPFAVVPRFFYLPGLDVSKQNRHDRILLFNFLAGWERPHSSEIRAALNRLDVSLACVDGASSSDSRVLRRAVRAQLRPVGHMNCGVL